MTEFTKQELLDLKPCMEWKIEILRWPRLIITAKEIKETLDESGKKNYEFVQIMSRSDKMSTAMIKEGVAKDV